jgi:hypothetical protein
MLADDPNVKRNGKRGLNLRLTNTVNKLPTYNLRLCGTGRRCGQCSVRTSGEPTEQDHHLRMLPAKAPPRRPNCSQEMSASAVAAFSFAKRVVNSILWGWEYEVESWLRQLSASNIGETHLQPLQQSVMWSTAMVP